MGARRLGSKLARTDHKFGMFRAVVVEDWEAVMRKGEKFWESIKLGDYELMSRTP